MGRRRKREEKKKNRKNRRVIDWLQLEKDVLELIAIKLTVLVDFIRFGAVCKTWRSTFLENRHHPLLHKLPVLMIPGSDDKNNEFWSFFILSEKQTYRFKKLPEEKDRYCCGCSEGYLIMVDPNLNIYLLNLFYGIETHLPCLTISTEFISVRGMYTGDLEYTCQFPIPDHPTLVEIAQYVGQYIYKAIKAGPYVVAILAKQCVLAFCKLDGDAWTYMQNKFRWEDLVCYKGKFYVIGYNGHVGVLDVSGLHPTLTIIVEGDVQYSNQHCRKYLVESSGQLLMVVRKIEQSWECFARWTIGFKIFRVDVNKHLCFPINSLGDVMLFWGEKSLVSLSAQDDFSSHEGNRIYFLVSWNEDNYLCTYNLEDGIFKNCKMDLKGKQQYSIWLTPKLR